jgi:hypothetical protein
LRGSQVGSNSLAATEVRASKGLEVLAALAKFGALWLEDVRRKWCQGDAAACSRLVSRLVDARLCEVWRFKEDGRRRYLVARPEGLQTVEGDWYDAIGYPYGKLSGRAAERLADSARLLFELMDAGMPEDWLRARDKLDCLARGPIDRSLVGAVEGPDSTAVLLAPPIDWRKVGQILGSAPYVDLWVVVVTSWFAWRRQIHEWLQRRVSRRIWVPRPGEAPALLLERFRDPRGWRRRVHQLLVTPARSRKGPAMVISGFRVVRWGRGSPVRGLCTLDGCPWTLHDFRPVPVNLLASGRQTEEVSGTVGLVSDEKQAHQLARVLGWSPRFAYLWVGDGQACLWTVEDKRLVPRWAQHSSGRASGGSV